MKYKIEHRGSLKIKEAAFKSRIFKIFLDTTLYEVPFLYPPGGT